MMATHAAKLTDGFSNESDSNCILAAVYFTHSLTASPRMIRRLARSAAVSRNAESPSLGPTFDGSALSGNCV